MKKALVPLAEGFEEIEAITIIDVLRRGGIEVAVASISSDLIVTGSHAIPVTADALLREISDSFDIIVLPGGMPGTINLQNDEKLIGLLNKQQQEKKYIGAICAAPRILAHTGIAKGIRATSHPSVTEILKDSEYSEDRVVVDGHIVTSRGAGTAMEFALQLVELLVGKVEAEKIKTATLA